MRAYAGLSSQWVACAALVCCMGLVMQPGWAVNLDFGKLKNTFSKVRQATGSVSDDAEVKIGGMVAATLLGAAPLVEHAPAQQYVNRVGMWVAQHTERAGLPWTFAVVDSENINAFATPGGYIVVTRGLFMALNSEAELAGVLGHEIGHVLRRHHLHAMQKDARMDLLGDLVVASAKDPVKKQQLDKLVNAGTQLYIRGLDRQDEYEADRLGVVLAARAGYDPYVMLDVLTTLDSLNPDEKSLALLLKTHPPFAERIVQLDQSMAEKLNAYAVAPRVEDRLLEMQKSLLAVPAASAK